MQIFQLYFSIAEIACFSVLFLALIYQEYFYMRYINGVKRYYKKQKKTSIDFISSQPPVSVIICAKNEEDNLKKFLPLILTQQYADFEVIVIDDGSYDNTSIVLDSLKKIYPNLRSTFVPKETKNISTKKLGISLGIKAAKNELLLLTDADCYPASEFWLAKMVRNFTSKTDIVLGYGAYTEENTVLNRMITYDTLFNSLQFLGMAIVRKAYMGVGRNLAYRKSAFFENGGFTPTLHLKSGDDDLFVNRVATRTNTRVEVSPESVTWSEPKHLFKEWLYQKMRHLSVSGSYSFKSKVQIIIEPLTRATFYLAFCASFILGIFGSIFTCAAAVFLFLIRYFTQFLTINAAVRHFGNTRKYVFSLLVADIFIPLFNLFILIIKRPFKRSGNFFWK
ncbi:MAG: glycosyltransferase [Paludibacter sp.]|nr:glycosyltransferase [Paludibacter sp.]